MRLNKIKIRILVAIVSVMTVFSCFGLGASAAGFEPKEIIKDLTEKAVEKAISLVPGGDIVQDLLNKGAGYIVGWVFGEEEATGEQDPTVQDVLDRLEEMSDKIDKYHDEQMGQMRQINANIDTKDFRTKADSIVDDYKSAINKMQQNSANIRKDGVGVIDRLTYRAYKEILKGRTCNPSELVKNFNSMKEYVSGERIAADKQPGYEITSKYLIDRLIEGYDKNDHDWTTSMDFLKVVEDVNGEIASMHANAVLDAVTMLMLNNMAYKVREYEIANGIYVPTEKEKPYASYEKFAGEVAGALAEMDKYYREIVRTNAKDHELVQAVVELSDPVGGKKVKGFRSFEEAWAQAYSTDKDFTITGYQDVKAVKGNGYNIDNLDREKYGFTANPSGFHVKKGRKITVNLTGHSFDGSAETGALEVFGVDDNATLVLKNAKIIRGQHAIYVKECSNVTVTLENVHTSETSGSAVLFRSPDSRNMKLTLEGCTFKNTKAGSAVRLASPDCVYQVFGCTFEKNHGSSGGGAINCPSASQENRVADCEFTENDAEGYGGAILTKYAKVTNSRFVKNRSAFKGRDNTGYGNKGAGGAINTDNLICIGCTFDGNSTNDQAGAIIINDPNWGHSHFRITDCIFKNNSSPNVGGAIRVYKVGSDSQQEISNCTFDDNKSGKGYSVFMEISENGFREKLFKKMGNKGNQAYDWYFYADRVW